MTTAAHLAGLRQCEACDRDIGPTEPYTCDTINLVYLCSGCAPTWQEMADDPTRFHDGDGEPLTRTEAKKLIAAHLAKGGKLSDPVLTHGPDERAAA